MSGSELVATLNSYSTRKDFESEIECERKTYATNFKDCYPKPIKDIYKLIGTFPFRTLICQHNQLSYYDCDESGEDGVFLVKRQSSTLCTKSPTREDGMLTKQEALRLEAGIGNCTIFNYRTHKVSIFSCSCKFHISWGLPCRHMLRVHFFYNWKKFECVKINIIAKQWFIKPLLRNDSTFLSVEVDVSEERNNCSKTIAERRGILSKYASILIESSCSSQSKFEGSVDSIIKRIKEVSGRDISGDDVFINPDNQLSKRQRRCFPADLSAPTGKSYKAASQQMKAILNKQSIESKSKIISL